MKTTNPTHTERDSSIINAYAKAALTTNPAAAQTPVDDITFLRRYSVNKGGLIPLDNLIESHADLLAALSVLVLTPETISFLEAHDPKALAQARAAIARAKGGNAS